MTLPPYLYDIQVAIEEHARGYGLDFYPQIFEILDYKTMNEVASFGGFPTRYPHWRFGMEYEKMSKSYKYGLSKIYEMVINNNPCYAYLLEGNSLVDQKMVIAHVCGHNDFFKNNYYFSKTNRRMMDEMANHATRVRRYMERFGVEKVESFIDVCLSLDNLIDPMSMFIKRRPTLSHEQVETSEDGELPEGKPRLKAKGYMDRYINPPEEPLTEEEEAEAEAEEALPPRFPAEPQRDLLLFLTENAPLEPWQSDILDIVREEAYYFSPQGMTKIMNEGWATYWHSKIMTQKVLDSSEIIDYADNASGVLGGGASLNPYKVGLELLKYVEHRWDTGRFGAEWENCEDLDERRAWDRQLGQGREKIFQVRSLYNDVMFIDEFFTEDFCREQLFFTYGWNKRNEQWEIQSRQYEQIKGQLLDMLTHGGNPRIDVVDANFANRGELLLEHQHQGTDLRVDWAEDTLENLYKLWKRPVHLATVLQEKGKRISFDGSEHSQSDHGEASA